MRVLILTEIAQVYMREGDAEFDRKKIKDAVSLYSKGIDVNCKDEELNAILYSKRWLSYVALGEFTLESLFKFTPASFLLSYISSDASFENLMIH